eukprot:comp21412_c0_seq1/m.46290 comp21412_c0_seq1/g.46290  ORF comp21412_c0_seq1/g.46290 comp21412_c0_seq1/m.46290 type:complete len:388 (-) comp21412_c0_seq1:58-1221(-)
MEMKTARRRPPKCMRTLPSVRPSLSDAQRCRSSRPSGMIVCSTRTRLPRLNAQSKILRRNQPLFCTVPRMFFIACCRPIGAVKKKVGLHSANASLASSSSTNTISTPLRMHGSITLWCSWLAGKCTSSITSFVTALPVIPRSMSNIATCEPSAQLTSERCVCTTPLGTPVVPLEKNTLESSPGAVVGAANALSSAWRMNWSSSTPYGEAPPSEICSCGDTKSAGSNCGSSGGGTVPVTGAAGAPLSVLSGSALLNTSSRFGSLKIALALVITMTRLTCVCEKLGMRPTVTAPASWMPQSTTGSSPLISSQISTRSPWPMPLWRSATAIFLALSPNSANESVFHALSARHLTAVLELQRAIEPRTSSGYVVPATAYLSVPVAGSASNE